jgi:hypothetical protein
MEKVRPQVPLSWRQCCRTWPPRGAVRERALGRWLLPPATTLHVFDDVPEVVGVRLRKVLVRGILQMTGGPPGNPSQPVGGEVVFLLQDAEDATFRADAAADGRFALRVPPGRYRVEGSSPMFAGGGGKCRSETAVDVSDAGCDDVVVS